MASSNGNGSSTAERLKQMEQDLASVDRDLKMLSGKDGKEGGIWSRLDFKGSSGADASAATAAGRRPPHTGSVHDRLTLPSRHERERERERDSGADAARRRASRDDADAAPPRKRSNNDGEAAEGAGEETKQPTVASTITVGRAARRPSEAAAGADGGAAPGSATDDKLRARNKRMFGMLLGTLQQAQRSAERPTTTEKKYAEVEKRYEDKARQEREDTIQERTKLLEKKKQLQEEYHRLKQEEETSALLASMTESYGKYAGFIRLKAAPKIFYKPKRHTPETERRLAETQAALEAELAAVRGRLTTLAPAQHDSEPEAEEGDGQGEPAGEDVSKEEQNHEQQQQQAQHEEGTGQKDTQATEEVQNGDQQPPSAEQQGQQQGSSQAQGSQEKEQQEQERQEQQEQSQKEENKDQANETA